ncbi:MAG: alpha-amylase family glycosyl hydrolase [Bacteroidota bacterium]
MPNYKPVFEFHIERTMRNKFNIDTSFFSTNGSVVFSNFAAVRNFAHKYNAKNDPRIHVYPGELHATAMLEEIYHIVIRQYEKQLDSRIFHKIFETISSKTGRDNLHKLLFDFADKFPPQQVYTGEKTINQYLQDTTGGRNNNLILLEEMIMLFFSNYNPANKKLKKLFDENFLEEKDTFLEYIGETEEFLKDQPRFGTENQTLFDLFRAPIHHAPEDISKQLDYVIENWKQYLPDHIFTLLLRSKDLLREDVHFDTTAGAQKPTMAPRYLGATGESHNFTIGKSGYRFADEAEKDYEEPEQFTPDVHWMPSVVMLAKNTYVWLDQLSKKYQRDISTLDQIPDEELDLISKQHFTGLWLIGIWERSEASKRIKHIMGNIDAVSSAYSLYDYQIAQDLGGEQAYQNLNRRTRNRGIRLASDMVPNHTGLFSKWIIEHPDYFIQTDHPPFPGYTFTGENLSQDPDIEIRIEDGYFSKTDAAVVFQRIDKRTHEVRYIYHGNDGTMMPWNDTAQLDMIKKEVREAVIQKIFDVAAKFSIIRFDAAMTLAKKHFSRLWYPRPGSGGDIPSRADYAMSKKQFDELFPVEFWREVVDRMNEQMPETLLLAEAFWFMEGYFVRTLGMHRVYNSAFMHMLKNEENEKFRDLITNTLEFEPEILKRYVNFMSNPDEETAISQFGTGDKYFGVCVLMCTLPGLPMFAHGQIEGYNEKYGMEYQRAYYNEDPQQWLIEKHEKQIFPLTQKRYLFSDVNQFNIFDFLDYYGNINENVFAYTNVFGQEKALVLYNNKYEKAHGKIQFSAPKLTRTSKGKETISVSLAQALQIKDEHGVYYLFKEHFSGLEYLKTGNEIHQNGFQWDLQGFEYRIFWNFQEIFDADGQIGKLYWKIAGNGIESLEKVRKQMIMEPLHLALEAIFHEDIIDFLIKNILNERRSTSEKLGYTLMKSRFKNMIAKIVEGNYTKLEVDTEKISAQFVEKVKSMERTFDFVKNSEHRIARALQKAGTSSLDHLLVTGSKTTYRENTILMLALITLQSTASIHQTDNETFLFGKLLLHWPLEKILSKTGKGQPGKQRDMDLIRLLLSYEEFNFSLSKKKSENHHQPVIETTRALQNEKTGENTNRTDYGKHKKLLEFIQIKTTRDFLGLNEYKGTNYFSKESFEELVKWILTLNIQKIFLLPLAHENENDKANINLISEKIEEEILLYLQRTEFSEKSGYVYDQLISLIKQNEPNHHDSIDTHADD